MAEENKIEIRNLYKAFGKKKVLDIMEDYTHIPGYREEENE